MDGVMTEKKKSVNVQKKHEEKLKAYLKKEYDNKEHPIQILSRLRNQS